MGSLSQILKKKKERLTKRSKSDLFKDSSWIRSVLEFDQKKKNGVSTLSSLTIDKEFSVGGFEAYVVQIYFKNSKNEEIEVEWRVKTWKSSDFPREIRIYSGLLSDFKRFLREKLGKRLGDSSVNLLPVSVFVQSPAASEKSVFALVTRAPDRSYVSVMEEERCTGLNYGHFQNFLITLAQFHFVGLHWVSSSVFEKDPIINCYPYLRRNTNKNLSSLLSMYRKILLFAKRKSYASDMNRRLKLFSELTKNSKDILKTDREDVLYDSLCIGAPVPSELLFSTRAEPFAAIVNTCHRMHFGHAIRDVTTCFYSLPNPIIRTHYLIPMIKSYCELFNAPPNKLTYTDFLKDFFEAVPYGIIRAILLHMRRTDVEELDHLVSTDSYLEPRVGENDYYVPLSPKRVKFLISFTDLVYKSI